MKTNISIIKTTAITITIIAAVAVFGSAGHLNAQEKGSAKGGAHQLMSKPVKTLEDLSAVKPGDMMVIACPKCKDVTVHYVKPTFKATEPKDKVKTRHECPRLRT
ncbi:MAG: hypothetical protein IH623_08525 [Verrucomicrobia bacterium]|nr:hypothetical protein [Verrucomicrobiota bacterium]